MNTDNVKKILTSKLSKDDVNLDGFININLAGKQRLLPTNDINKIVDASEVFNKERQSSPYYRIIGTISPVITNCLMNLSDAPLNDSTLSVFNNTIFLDKSYPLNNTFNDAIDITYPTSLKSNLKEKDGWFGYFDPNIQNRAICKFIDMEPKRERFSFIPDITPYKPILNQKPVKNWELTITYPADSYTAHTIIRNGLLVFDKSDVIVSEKPMTAFATPVKHNLNTGDSIKLFNTSTNSFDGEYVVSRIGLDNGDLKDYYFVLDITGVTLTNNTRIKKTINGVESQYYFRKFKKIKTRTSPMIEYDDYEVYPAAFSENFFNDQNYQFVFNEDIDVSDLKDNLGRPLSELFLTVFKTDSNNLFTGIKSGIEMPFFPKLVTSNTNLPLKDIPVINLIHNGPSTIAPPPSIITSHTPLESSLTPNSSFFFGDVVEYNTETLNEVVLADVMHRFNTINREQPNSFTYVSEKTITAQNTVNITQQTINMGPRYEGYYYKAHHRIEIRQFSDYIEQADPIVVGIPTYATLEDGKYKWRELVDIGFDQGSSPKLDYPFLNNAHYRYGNYNFWVKRQDPYGLWGLIYTDFPSDVLGDRITNKFKVNEADNVC
jgi:hypothetical protein